MNPPTIPQMLEGIRIVDLTTVVFGPYATRMLADLGADVIKVETPKGDDFRHVGASEHTIGMGPGHLSINKGKRSIVLDLKQHDDLETMMRLLSTADIFIHNVRGSAIERLGLGYDVVRSLVPDIIYVHCTGFGSDGTYSGLQAYDDVIQAASGAATLTSRADGNPRPRYIPSLIADKNAGLHGAYAMLAALFHKQRTGKGQHVEVPMFEAFVHFMLTEHLHGATFGLDRQWGYPRQIDPARQPFRTADGYIGIVPYTDAKWLQLFELFGHSQIWGDERFATPALRAGNVSLLYEEIGRHTPAKATDVWMTIFQAAQIPAMPVRDLSKLHEDPHLASVNFFQKGKHPTEGEIVELRPPVRFQESTNQALRAAPTIGEHTQEIIAELDALKPVQPPLPTTQHGQKAL